jgi:hypothetical protein
MKHPVMWFEVLGKDAGKLCQFYGSLFGWSFGGDPSAYGLVQSNGRGIPGGVGVSYPGTREWVTFYVETPDITASLAHVEQLGRTRRHAAHRHARCNARDLRRSRRPRDRSRRSTSRRSRARSASFSNAAGWSVEAFRGSGPPARAPGFQPSLFVDASATGCDCPPLIGSRPEVILAVSKFVESWATSKDLRSNDAG